MVPPCAVLLHFPCVGTRQHDGESLVFTSEMVTRSLLMARWGRAGLRTLLLAWATLGASVVTPNRVHSLNLYGPDAGSSASRYRRPASHMQKTRGESMHFAQMDLKLR
jgi:hypothetical protein